MARPIGGSRLDLLTAPLRRSGPKNETGTRGWLRFEPRRREVFGVLALMVVAATISLTAPIVSPSSASQQIAVLPSGPDPLVDPTDTPIPTLGPTPSGTENPGATATDTPSATPTPRPNPTAKPVPKAPVVRTFAALGDSLTAWPSGDPWPSRLDAADSRLRLVKNAGVPGNTTGQMRARLSQIYAAHPQVMFLLGGTNDLGLGYSQSSIIANLRAIILDAKAHKIWVIVLLVPPDSYTSMASRIESLNNAIIGMARSLRVTYVDIHRPLTNSSGTYISRYTSDGLHFSDLGAQVVANTIRARIRLLGL